MRGALANNNGNNSLETINAAANAIVSADQRVQQATVQRKRWGSCWSLPYWCFGYPRQGKRFSHAVLVPETTLPENDVPAADNSTHASTVTLPFVAPPSSPASFIQSEPPSSSQSPGGFFSLSLSANVYSPSGPSSIFAIGPYAHETQLVSPPVFSTFTTEPSTAPFTPPPESVHLTTPSSPEVPFAQFLSSSLDTTHKSQETAQTFPSPFPSSHYEFQAYQFYPGSPVGQLISPSSVVSGSGTSSPFPDFECLSGRRPTAQISANGFFINEPPKLCSADDFACRKLSPQQDLASSSLSSDSHRATANQDNLLLESQILAIGDLTDESHNHEFNPRVSFGLSAEEVASCSKTEQMDLAGAESEIQTEIPVVSIGRGEETPQPGTSQCRECQQCRDGLTSHLDTSVDLDEKSLDDRDQQQQPSPAISAVREFKFDNADGAVEPTISSEWWTNEKTRMEAGPNNWAFFPIVQPGVS